ncbi:MAG: TraB/GumN family protein [Flavobacteriales bacterium]
MKKILFAFLALTSFGQAQLLYQISGNGLIAPSFIYGTIHMLPKEQFKLSASLKRAFEASTTIAMEVDLDMSTAQKIAMAQNVLLPEGKTLRDFMNEQDYLQLKMYCLDSLGWNESKFERSSKFKPIFFSSFLMQESMKDMASYEMEFNKMAKKKHKQTIGLETVEFQLSLFDQLPMQTQVDMLKTDYNSDMKNFDTLLTCYLNEDLEKLAVLMNAETAAYPEFNELLLVKRNKSWIAPMRSQMAKESTFFAVGAGHLAGEQGVLALLKQAGYTVSAIKQD